LKKGKNMKKVALSLLLIVGVLFGDNMSEAESYFQSGMSYDELKDYTSAIKSYTKVIELNPNILEAYYNRGWAYGLSGDYKSAMMDARTACRLGDCSVVQDMAQRGWMTE
jgi:tetratricopeptide (TPR) repeat protein